MDNDLEYVTHSASEFLGLTKNGRIPWDKTDFLNAPNKYLVDRNTGMLYRIKSNALEVYSKYINLFRIYVSDGE